jgi:hypothetical protein
MRLAEETSVTTVAATDGLLAVVGGKIEQVTKADFIKAIEATHNEVLTFDADTYTPTTLVQGGGINYTLAASGHIDGAVKRIKLQSDGVNAITFPSGTRTYGLPDTGILPAGQHVLWLVYLGGELEVSIPTNAATGTTPVDDTQNGDVKLSTPASIAATPNGTTTIDVIWEQVPNNLGYQLQVSIDNSTWSNLGGGTLPQNTLTYSHGGLNPGTTRYYRVRAKGNGTTYGDGDYTAPASATTFDWGQYGNINGLVLNLQADNALNIETDGSTYFKWIDRSNLASHWQINDATMLPTYNSASKAVQFGGLSRLYGQFQTLQSRAGTLFYVLDKLDTTTVFPFSSPTGGGDYIRHSTTTVTMAVSGGSGIAAGSLTTEQTDNGVFVFRLGNTASEVYRNGNMLISTAPPFSKETPLGTMGCWPNNSTPFNGLIKAVVAYNRELTVAEITEVTGWLNTSYAIF